MHSEPVNHPQSGSLRLGLCLYLLLAVVLMAHEARADSCRLSVSQPRIDYGLLRQAQLREEQTGRTALLLGTRTLYLSVMCPDSPAMALRFTGAAAGSQGFRFGRDGHFTLNVRQAQVDGRAVELISPQAPDETSNGRLAPGQVLVARAGGAPVTGRRFTAQVDIETYLPARAFSVRRETTFEGQGHFEWVPVAGISQAAPPSQ